MSKKKVTIKEVAKAANVGISVVSYILNNTPGKTITPETRQRVLDAVQQLNYVPNAMAQSMRTQRIQNIGLVHTWEMTKEAFVNVLNGIVEVLERRGYSLTLCSIDHDHLEQSHFVKYYQQRKIEGVLFISHPSQAHREQAYIACLQKYGIPYVVMMGTHAHPSSNMIHLNYRHTAYLAAQYFAQGGHQRIGYVLSLDYQRKMPLETEERFQGYRQALADYHLETNEDFVLAIDLEKPDGDQMKIRDYLTRRMKEAGITALVAYKAITAVAVMKQAAQAGIRIPTDCPLIAANHENFASYLHPPLTTVEFPMAEVGRKGAETLLQVIEQPNLAPAQITYSGTLTLRDSHL